MSNFYIHGSKFVKAISSGSGDITIIQPDNNNSSDIQDISEDIRLLLVNLVNNHQSFDENTKKELLRTELTSRLINDSDFKDRFLRSLKAGTDSLVKVFDSNPFVSVSLSVVKAWFFK